MAEQARFKFENDVDLFVWMVEHLERDELTDFATGLGNLTQEIRSNPQRRQALIDYVDAWMLTIRLRCNPDYVLQVKDYRKRAMDADLGTPISDEAEIRKLLSL